MARNQKRETVELRWHRLLLVVGLVAAIAVLTVGYVLQRRAHDELGQQIKAVEVEIGWVRERVTLARVQVERCRRKDSLIGQAQKMGLELIEIPASQRLTIPLLGFPPQEPAKAPVSSSVASPVPVAPLATAGRMMAPR